jgi:hypothetical protein
MQLEQAVYDNFADLWQSAQRRRTEDICSLGIHFFRRRWQSRSPVALLAAPLPCGFRKEPKGGPSGQ